MEGNPKPTLLERIMAKVTVMPDGCWLWTGAKSGMPPNLLYGTIRANGKNRKAHRVLWEITNGINLGVLHLLHKCDNPLCVNPDHMFPGTHQDNSDDKIAKGRDRHPKGEALGASKLTAAQVLQIRADASQGEAHIALGQRHHVHPSTISLIVNRKNWTHI